MNDAAGGTVRTVRTMCPMNCHPTLCGMLVDVRDAEVTAVRGDAANPDSRGFLCIRGQAAREIVGNPARLLHPLVRDRRDAPFRRASWNEAMTRVVDAVRGAPPSATALWPGHGTFANNYGTRVSAQLMARFANLYGAQFWSPTMICWGLGAFGLGLTGLLETHTQEDLGAHAELVVMWGASFASQPNTAPHVLAAKRRGARVIAIDVRRTDVAAKADEVLLVRPGTDTALALATLHVICAEGLHDAAFVERHTVGFGPLREHLRKLTPQWAADISGVPAERIARFARRYASTRPAMIVLGGSSMHKGANGSEAARAIACLPAITGNVGIPGGGLGPRHGSAAHGRGLGNITAADRRQGASMPNQMAAISEALQAGRVATLLLLGSNMLSSFADANTIATGLARTKLVVAYDLFMNDTARQFADIVLPATCWLEELGCKATSTHLYLTERALEPAGETRSAYRLLADLARQLNLADLDPWGSEEALLDAVLDHPATGHASVAALRAEGGMRAMKVSHVAHPDLAFETPSGKLELYSERAASLGLPPLPDFTPVEPSAAWPLRLAHGRTLSHFHSFYDHGRALPTLAGREREPLLWISSEDAARRGLRHGDPVRICNERGGMDAKAHVTDSVPPGVVWMRDGWAGLNRLTSCERVLPDAAVDVFAFSAGQARFASEVEVSAALPGAASATRSGD
jgi:anaerobic selenocysteine-containing dehydrogenase